MEQKKLNSNTAVVIMFGPPGAGKGTQAELLAEHLGLYHFETSKIIEEALNSHTDQEYIEIDGVKYLYKDERRKFSSGELNSPPIVAFWVKERIRNLAQKGQPTVFSGSPRTTFEADQIYPFLISLFPKEAICVLELTVPSQTSIDRNVARRICSSCRLPHPKNYDKITSRRCGNALMLRGSIDTEPVIIKRLGEFALRTMPAVERTKEYGFAVNVIDGNKDEQSVFKDICVACKLNI